MGIFGMFKKKEDVVPVAVNPLEQERLDKIKKAKDTLYENVFNAVTEKIKYNYADNLSSGSTWVSGLDSSVMRVLDKDTIHKVTLKATHDAATKLQIKFSSSPNIDVKGSTVSVGLRWSMPS